MLRIWQPADRVVAVRWCVRAVPRVLSSFGVGVAYVDGVSEYKFKSKVNL